MNGRRTSVALVAAITSSLAFAAPAHAQAPTADSEFKRGKQLMTEGKLAAACEAFDRSQQLEPNVSTMLNQGNCREKNNQLATARAIFTQAAIQTDRSSDVKIVQLHNVALERAAKLGARVSVVTVDVPAAARVPGLIIKRDGTVIEPVTWGTPIELDGGTYTFEASAAGYTPWSITVSLAAEKEKKTVAVPPLVAIATTPVDTTKPGDTTTPVDTSSPGDTTKPVDTAKPAELPPRPEVPESTPSRTPAYIVGGAGLAIIVASIGVHVWASGLYDDAILEGNDDTQVRLWHEANTRRSIAVGGYIAGTAAIGAAVWLYLRAKPEPAVSVQPGVWKDGGSVLVTGHF